MANYVEKLLNKYNTKAYIFRNSLRNQHGKSTTRELFNDTHVITAAQNNFNLNHQRGKIKNKKLREGLIQTDVVDYWYDKTQGSKGKRGSIFDVKKDDKLKGLDFVETHVPVNPEYTSKWNLGWRKPKASEGKKGRSMMKDGTEKDLPVDSSNNFFSLDNSPKRHAPVFIIRNETIRPKKENEELDLENQDNVLESRTMWPKLDEQAPDSPMNSKKNRKDSVKFHVNRNFAVENNAGIKTVSEKVDPKHPILKKLDSIKGDFGLSWGLKLLRPQVGCRLVALPF